MPGPLVHCVTGASTPVAVACQVRNVRFAPPRSIAAARSVRPSPSKSPETNFALPDGIPPFHFAPCESSPPEALPWKRNRFAELSR